MPASNADRMGLKAGDVLVRLNDQSVPASMDIADALEDTAPGSKIDLLVARANLPVELSGIYQPQFVASPPRHLFARAAPSGLTNFANSFFAITELLLDRIRHIGDARAGEKFISRLYGDHSDSRARSARTPAISFCRRGSCASGVAA